MVKRFYPNKKELRELLHFKSQTKDVQNALSPTFGTTTMFLKLTKDETQTKITVCSQQVKKYNGKQAFVQTTAVGTIAYYEDKKRVYTAQPREVIHFLQRNYYIVKALGIEAFITEIPYANRLSERELEVSSLELFILSNKIILKSIFRGNCTNKDNAFRRYTKATYGMNISLNHFVDITQKTSENRLRLLLAVTSNFQNLYRFLMDPPGEFTSREKSIMNDLFKMSETLRRKVNFKWSFRRMEEEHDKLVKELIRLTAQGTPFTGVEYDVDPPEIEGITFFKDNIQLLTESKIMKHCIGTSPMYMEKMLDKNSLLIGYDRNGCRGTASLNVRVRKNPMAHESVFTLTKGQFYGHGNSPLPDKAHVDLNKIIEQIEQSPFAEYLTNYHLRAPEKPFTSLNRDWGLLPQRVDVLAPEGAEMPF